MEGENNSQAENRLGKRKMQNDNIKQLDEVSRQRQKTLADKKVEQQEKREGSGAKQGKPYKSLEERQINADYRYVMDNLKKQVQDYENAKKNVEQLEKINKSLENLKDKKVIEKYQTTKKSLEKKICGTLGIKKDKPKLWQSKKVVEQSFRNKVQKGLADMGTKADVAKKKIAETKCEKNTQTSQRENKPVGRTTNRAKAIVPQTRTRARVR